MVLRFFEKNADQENGGRLASVTSSPVSASPGGFATRNYADAAVRVALISRWESRRHRC
jgi:hypothetical protein